MGKIEYDVRMILRIADAPADETILYLACAREFYADLDNTKGDKVQEALDKTTEKWLTRRFKADLVKRIRNRVTDVYTSLKAPKPSAPRVEAQTHADERGEEPTDSDAGKTQPGNEKPMNAGGE
jgi:hypothetical protein